MPIWQTSSWIKRKWRMHGFENWSTSQQLKRRDLDWLARWEKESWWTEATKISSENAFWFLNFNWTWSWHFFQIYIVVELSFVQNMEYSQDTSSLPKPKEKVSWRKSVDLNVSKVSWRKSVHLDVSNIFISKVIHIKQFSPAKDPLCLSSCLSLQSWHFNHCWLSRNNSLRKLNCKIALIQWVMLVGARRYVDSWGFWGGSFGLVSGCTPNSEIS